jgi:NADH-quinone oxidoreductase subunit M
MGGFGARMPGIATFFTIACLSSLGLPGTAGFAAELMVFLGAWQSAHAWWAIPAILGAFVTAVYVLRASRAIFWGPHERHTDVGDARGSEWLAPVILATAIIVLGVWPRLITDLIDGTTLAYLADFGGLR